MEWRAPKASDFTSLGLIWMDPILETRFKPHPLSAIAGAIAWARHHTPAKLTTAAFSAIIVDQFDVEADTGSLLLALRLYCLIQATKVSKVWTKVRDSIIALIGCDLGTFFSESADSERIPAADLKIEESKIVLLTELYCDSLPRPDYTGPHIKLSAVKRRCASMLLSIPYGMKCLCKFSNAENQFFPIQRSSVSPQNARESRP